MTMKQFKTAALEVERNRNEGETGEPELIRWQWDEDIMEAYYPDETQVAFYASAFADGATLPNQMKATLDFLEGICTPETYRLIARRAKLPKHIDPFGLEDIEVILENIMDETTGHPTRPSSSSTGSQGNTGNTSTVSSRPVAQKRSPSRRVDSAT